MILYAWFRLLCLPLIVVLLITTKQKSSVDGCAFLSQPNDVTVMLGNSAEFRCECEMSSSIPSWKIKGLTYPDDRLPSPYYFDTETFSLTIPSVTLSMNRTTIQCIVNHITFSRVATLTVIQKDIQYPHNETISSQHLFATPVSTYVAGVSQIKHLTTTVTPSVLNISATKDMMSELMSSKLMSTSAACLVSNYGCLRPESEKSIYVAIIGGFAIVFGGVIIFILGLVMCYKRHHRTKKPETKNSHIYDEPQFLEPIYEQVSPTTIKTITTDSNEAYHDHITMGTNEAYQTTQLQTT